MANKNAPKEVKQEEPDDTDGILAEITTGPPIDLSINTNMPAKRVRRVRQVLDPSPIQSPSSQRSTPHTVLPSPVGGATATATITETPLNLPALLNDKNHPSTSSDNDEITEDNLMICTRCNANMRTVMRRHRVQGQMVQFPALRCTRKGCQTYKSLRVISGEVMPRIPINDKREIEDVRSCINGWRSNSTANDDEIRATLNEIRFGIMNEVATLQNRIATIKELQEWYEELLLPVKKEEDDAAPLADDVISSLSGRSRIDHINRLLRWTNEKKIRVEVVNVPQGKWTDEEFESIAEMEKEKELLTDASRELGMNLDGLSPCCRKLVRKNALLPGINPSLAAEVLNTDAINAAQPSPTDTAGSVLKSLLNQKKMDQFKKQREIESVLMKTVHNTDSHKRVEKILSREQPTPTNTQKAKRSKSDATVVLPLPRAYNSLSKGVAMARKRSAAADDIPPPIKAWKKVNGEWKAFDVDTGNVDDETRLKEHRERLDREERLHRQTATTNGKDGSRYDNKQRLNGSTDEETYGDWIIEERARMSQLADIERDIDEQEMLKEDFDESAPLNESPRKKEMRRKEIDRRLKELNKRKEWMDNELSERRRQMAIVKASMDIGMNGNVSMNLRNALDSALSQDIDVNQLLMSLAGSTSSSPIEMDEEEEEPPTLSTNEAVANILAKIKGPC